MKRVWPLMVRALVWASSPLVLAQGTTQEAPLVVTNIRGTYGERGPARPDLKILPGDVLYVAFDIKGLQTEPKTKQIRFHSSLVVADDKGKPLVKKGGEVSIANVLGAEQIPHAIILPTGLMDPPGRYQLTVTIQDLIGKGKTSFTRAFEVLKPAFGLVRFQVSYDIAGELRAPPIGVAGQVMYVHVSVVGFKLHPETGGSVRVEMLIHEADGKPVTTQPLASDFKNIDPNTSSLPLWFELPLTRAGRFTIKLQATDRESKQTASLTIPFTALELPK